MSESRIYTQRVDVGPYEFFEYKVGYINKYAVVFDSIQKFKYEGNKNLGRDFGELMFKELPEGYDLSGYDYLLPVPSTPSSLSDRGYDTVSLIGKRLSELCGLPLAGDILKALDRPSQVGLSWAERVKNVEGSFHLRNPSRVEGKSFVVLDDVTTTGSTLNEVILTLSTANPRRLDALVYAKRFINSDR